MNYFLEYIYLCVARVSVRAPHTNFGKTKSLAKEQEDSVLKYGGLEVTGFHRWGLHNVLFPSICKSPELFMFTDYVSNSAGPFDI